MMKRELTVTTNKQYWGIKNALEADGFRKIADCYWTVIFEKDGNQVIINRD